MTNEEHIEQLKKLRSFHNGSYGRSINKAIEALEQERSRLAQITQYRNDCEKLMQENEQLKKALEQKTCEDNISRQAVLEMAYDMSEIDGEHFKKPWMVVDVEDIQKLPSVKPQEPKTGHWIRRNAFLVPWKCSECNYESERYDNYCPNCGAKMW